MANKTKQHGGKSTPLFHLTDAVRRGVAPQPTGTSGDPHPHGLADALSRALVLRDQLHVLTDALNVEIAAAEASIAALKLGVSGSVTIDSDENGGERYLLFMKHNDQWRLLTARGDVMTDLYSDLMPLVNAPRSVRLAAVGSLGLLVEELAREVESELTAVQVGTAVARGFVASLSLPPDDMEPDASGVATSKPPDDDFSF